MEAAPSVAGNPVALFRHHLLRLVVGREHTHVERHRAHGRRTGAREQSTDSILFQDVDQRVPDASVVSSLIRRQRPSACMRISDKSAGEPTSAPKPPAAKPAPAFCASDKFAPSFLSLSACTNCECRPNRAVVSSPDATDPPINPCTTRRNLRFSRWPPPCPAVRSSIRAANAL